MGKGEEDERVGAPQCRGTRSGEGRGGRRRGLAIYGKVGYKNTTHRRPNVFPQRAQPQEKGFSLV